MALIEIRGVAKDYGGVHALRDFTLDLEAGIIHAICGENGAGKSTLNKILSGSVRPSEGEVRVNGKPLQLGSVREAEAAGIAMVHQESAAFLTLGAVENHQLMREPGLPGGVWLDWAEMNRRTKASLAELGESFDLSVPLEQLSLAQRQMVAIARALAGECQLLILDEPTASLSTRETEALFSAIRKLRDQGVAILYVSHRLEEIFALADQITVLRDGRGVATKAVADTTPDELIALMVGREVTLSEYSATPPGELRLSIRGITRPGEFRDVSFEVHAGEVVALAGLVGAGRSEVVRSIFGLDPVTSGDIRVHGRIALVPEDRQHEGLHLPLSLSENMSLAARLGGGGMVIDRAAERTNALAHLESLRIKADSISVPASSLSGGNQQKVLLGKWLSTRPDILILDEPTRGVDVGAKDQIHRLIRELASQGVAILVVSSELAEVMSLADRILVMRNGEVAGELSRETATQAQILQLALPNEDSVAAEASTLRTPKRFEFSREMGVGLLLLLTVIAAALVNPAFLSGGNIRDMLVKISPALIAGSMMTLMILAREIDISVGSLMGLCAATLGLACSPDRMGLPVPVGVALALGVGAAAGLLNGLLVAKARIPSIIVTLGMLTIFRGVTERLLGGKWVEHLPSGLRAFGTSGIAGLPYSVWMALLSVLIGIWLTRKTRFGLQVFALGSNPGAAVLRGVPVDRVKIGIFMLTGLATGVAALFSATQLQVIESGFGNGFELVVIASVIVGGTSIRGGRGSISGTVLGACLLGIISTVMIFLKLGGSATYWERAIQGGFILLAVLGDSLGRRKRGTE